MPSGDTAQGLYGPAMSITDPNQALRYLEELCVQLVSVHGVPQERVLALARENLGYYAGGW